MAVIGTLIAESLKPDAILELPLTLRRLHRVAVGQPAHGQPAVWTLIDFTCDPDDVATFAEQLASALDDGPWYVDLATDTTKFVVFAGRQFAFTRNDSAANQQAIEYARSIGIPEAQLDWPR